MDRYLRLFVGERLDLCTLLAGLSDEDWSAATLDEGWTVEDLAAHVVLRERYLPDVLRALLFKGRFGPTMEALMAREKERGHAALVAAMRAMPPLLFRLPGLAAKGNLAEAYIHNEDVRRGALHRARIIPEMLQQGLWESMSLFATRGVRLTVSEGTLTIIWPGHAQRSVPVGGRRRDGGEGATASLSGEPGDLLLWLTGRKAAAHVELEGADALVAALWEAPMSM